MKRFEYKVYSDGQFLSTLPDVSDAPRFTSYINSGLGDLTIRLPRPVFQFEEGTVIKHGNQVKVVCYDDDAPQGVTIYNGYISKYTPTLQEGKEYIVVTCLGFITQLERYMLEDPFTDEATPTMSANNVPSPYVSTASSSATPAWNAFDKSDTTRWMASGNSGWLKLDFGSGKTIKKYKVKACIAGEQNYSPKDWTFQGSNDGSSWTTLDTQTNQADWEALETREYWIDNETSYRYYRINITANNGPSEIEQTTIVELNMYQTTSGNANTEIIYNSKSPDYILGDVLDKYIVAGGSIDRDIDETNTLVSYTFNTYTIKEALNKIIELAPNGFYYFLDSDNTLHFNAKDVTANHTFVLGKDVISVVPEKSIENLVNKIYFTGGDVSGVPLYKKYERLSSVSEYGLYTEKIVDSRVTDTETMDIMAGAILDRNDSPETRTTLIIRDNNTDDGRGYDIESIKPGDTCKILGYNQKATNLWDQAIWDTDKWDYDITQVSSTVQQVMKVSYEPGKVTLELSSKLPNISHRVEDIKRNLTKLQTNDNPATPS